MEKELFQKLSNALEYRANKGGSTAIGNWLNRSWNNIDEAVIDAANWNDLDQAQAEKIYNIISNGSDNLVSVLTNYNDVIEGLDSTSPMKKLLDGKADQKTKNFNQWNKTSLRKAEKPTIEVKEVKNNNEKIFKPSKQVEKTVEQVVAENKEIIAQVQKEYKKPNAKPIEENHNYTKKKDSPDYGEAIKNMGDAFPELKSYMKKTGQHETVLMMHAGSGNTRNIYSENQVEKAFNTIREGATSNKPTNDIVYEIHRTLEGERRKSYKDSEGHRTIGVGTLLPPPDGKRQSRIKEIREVLGGNKGAITMKEYKKVYNGDVAISEQQSKDLHEAHMLGENGGNAIIDYVIKSVMGEDYDLSKFEPESRVMLESIAYQSPIALKKVINNPEKFPDLNARIVPAIKTLASQRPWQEGKEAQLELARIYQEGTLYKTHVENPMERRTTLALRGDFWKQIYMGDFNEPMSIQDVIVKANIMLRDHPNNTKIAIYGKMPRHENGESATLADILRHPDLDINKNTNLSLYYNVGEKTIEMEQKMHGFKKTYSDGKSREEGDFLAVSKLKENNGLRLSRG